MIPGITSRRGYRRSQAPLPTLPSSGDILYWFAADFDAYSNNGSQLATDGQKVQQWGNQGSAHDATQALAANRLTYKEGGANGKPYLQGNRTNQTHFENLTAITHPTGALGFNTYTCFAVFSDEDYTGNLGAILNDPTSDDTVKSMLEVNGSTVTFFKPAFTFTLPDTAANDVNVIMAQKKVDGSQGAFATNDVNRTGNSDGANAEFSAVTAATFLRRDNDLHFRGRLYEFIYYDGVLEDAAAAEVMNYLRTKYGLATVAYP